MKFGIILPAIGLIMVALSACTDPGEGGAGDTFNQQPAAPTAPQD